PRGIQRPEYDRALEGVLESRRILLPANRAVEMDRMLRFAAELKQPAVLYGMREGYRAAEVLKKGEVPVLISLKWPEKPRVADRIGSIEKGKIANLVVTRGELFDDRTRVEMTFIDGVKFTPAPEAERPAGQRPATPSNPGENQ